MIVQNIKKIIDRPQNKNRLYIRNLVKEEIQNYILNFVYNDSVFQNLIFTGGTCLRKLYGLDRLSEDLDFDYNFNFSIDNFALKVKNYFYSQLTYQKVSTKVSGNKQTVFIKLPLFKELNVYQDRTPEDVFVRCDFSKQISKEYGLNTGMITAGTFKVIVEAYDLETLFANKITAFLRRSFYKGKFQKLPFKGRDVYDLFWFLQISSKSGYHLKPNNKRLLSLIKERSMDQIKQDVKRKIALVDPKYVYKDVLPLVESGQFLNQFLEIFNKSIVSQIDMVM
ncbi:MAG: Protein containing DUF1814 [Microgenomates group bacterium GW2011_GWC1_43_11]|nr:MAG: Protein containing DUF1814 [Candidatus Gottesmanbacteria bacterium GW2011_GWA1_42_26]KKS90216.1 MAG: Protein containing DUF1814 [Microgenomates group bacterium GW2011_GWC1_43_11]HCM81806.1 hypothetical protein [Patescibacteria group bacterium]